MPATAPPWRTANATTGVGTAANISVTGKPWAANTSAAASANSSERCRASRPTTTSRPCRPRSLSTLRNGPGGTEDDSQVHSVRSTAQGPAQARRSERQGVCEPLIEVGVAALEKLGGGLGVGIVSDPLLRGSRGPRPGHAASVPTLVSAYASFRSTGATSITRSNSSCERLSRMVACNHSSRSARSASNSPVPAAVISIS